jgi:hypothetical protein
MSTQMIRGRRLLTLLPFAAMIVGLATYSPALAETYFKDLPTGVIEVTIDQGVDQGGDQGGGGGSDPGPLVVESTQPTFRGKVAPGTTSIEITIRSAVRTYTVPVDPVTGEWSFTVPDAIELGEHSLFINDELIGAFVVEPATQFTPPSTGNGGLLFSAEHEGTSVLQQLGLALATAGLTFGTALFVRRARQPQGS